MTDIRECGKRWKHVSIVFNSEKAGKTFSNPLSIQQMTTVAVGIFAPPSTEISNGHNFFTTRSSETIRYAFESSRGDLHDLSRRENVVTD